MSQRASFRKIVQALNQGKKYPALSLVQHNEQNAAVIAKLIKTPQFSHFDLTRSDSIYNINTDQFSQIASGVAERMRDSENIMQLFPDLELAAQILISSILSPKDMLATELYYKVREAILPLDVTTQCLKIIEEELTQTYEIKSILPDILRECLFISGSYVKVILPEASLDEIINANLYASTESIERVMQKTHVGILAQEDSGLKLPEALSRYVGANVKQEFARLIEVSDNYQYLKLPKLLQTQRRYRVQDTIAATEGHQERFSYQELEQLFYRRAEQKEVPFVAVKTRDQTTRRSIGRPLELKVPSESIIPVYVPGDPKAHIGYFILVDEEGNFVTYDSARESLGQMFNVDDKTNSIASMLTQKATYNLLGINRTRQELDSRVEIYRSIIEHDLLNRLKRGLLGGNVKLAHVPEVYHVMLSRTLAGQYTRLLYVPADLVSYFALKFHPNGTGKSLLDDLKVLTGLRAIILFAKVMAMAKNSINITRVNMTLDPNDPDPQKTIEMSINEVLKMRQQYFPLGINSPIDLVNWVQRAGFEFTFEGHPALPQTKFDFESKSFQHQLPDNELDELLRKQTIMAIGLSPETVDNGFNSEFATTVVANNILLSKRVQQFQDQFLPILTQYVQKLVFNDFTLRARLKEVLKTNLASLDKYLDQAEVHLRDTDESKFLEYLLDKLAMSLIVELPRPDTTSVETQTSAFEQYVESLDKSLDYWVSSEFMSEEVAGELSASIDAIKANLKAYFVRRWMVENGFLPELSEIIQSDDEGRPVISLYDITKEHIEGLMKSSLKFLDSLQGAKKAASKDAQAMGLTGEGGGSSESASEEGGFGEFGEEPGGGLELPPIESLGPEEGTEEEKPSEEEAPEKETPNEGKEPQ